MLARISNDFPKFCNFAVGLQKDGNERVVHEFEGKRWNDHWHIIGNTDLWEQKNWGLQLPASEKNRLFAVFGRVVKFAKQCCVGIDLNKHLDNVDIYYDNDDNLIAVFVMGRDGLDNCPPEFYLALWHGILISAGICFETWKLDSKSKPQKKSGDVWFWLLVKDLAESAVDYIKNHGEVTITIGGTAPDSCDHPYFCTLKAP